MQISAGKACEEKGLLTVFLIALRKERPKRPRSVWADRASIILWICFTQKRGDRMGTCGASLKMPKRLRARNGRDQRKEERSDWAERTCKEERKRSGTRRLSLRGRRKIEKKKKNPHLKKKKEGGAETSTVVLEEKGERRRFSRKKKESYLLP